MACAHLSGVVGLLIASLEEVSIFHAISWSSLKSKRPARSVAAGELLAAGESINEIIMLRKIYLWLLCTLTRLIVVLISNDSYTSLLTQC